MKTLKRVLLIVVVVIVCAAPFAGRMLVCQDARKADVILVLNGEDYERPALALRLLQQGYGRHVYLDAATLNIFYKWSEAELASRYIHELPPNLSSAVSVCPIVGQSTIEETDDIFKCLQPSGAHTVLVVTSDYHTRRALSTLKHRLPEFGFSIVAAHNPREFGVNWWQRREWAKQTVSEWARLIWWEAIERWSRRHH